jgi:hypothetical protein
LLRQGAPIDIAYPEAPGFSFIELAVPRRFPLARRAAEEAGRVRSREVEAYFKKHPADGEIDAYDEAIGRFNDAALEMTWKRAFWSIGSESGLIDIDGKAVSRKAAHILAEGKRIFLKARREHLLGVRLRSDEEFRQRYIAKFKTSRLDSILK